MNTSRCTCALTCAILFLCTLQAGENADPNAAMDSRQPAKFKQLPATVDSDGDYLVDAFEKALRVLANELYTDINEGGDL